MLRCVLNTPLKPNTMLTIILLKIFPIFSATIRADTFKLALDRGNSIFDNLLWLGCLFGVSIFLHQSSLHNPDHQAYRRRWYLPNIRYMSNIPQYEFTTRVRDQNYIPYANSLCHTVVGHFDFTKVTASIWLKHLPIRGNVIQGSRDNDPIGLLTC